MTHSNFINRVKGSRWLYHFYYFLGSLSISILKLFLKPDRKLVVFLSYGGRMMNDSPKAIYDAILNDKRFIGYNFVWAFREPNRFDVPIGLKVKVDSLKYYIKVLQARVWVTNVGITRGLNFTGIDSLEINTWHGSAIKFIGSDAMSKESVFKTISKKNVKEKRKRIFLAQSGYDLNIWDRALDISPEFVKMTGLPRNDELLKYNNTKNIKEIKDRLGIPNTKIVVLYAPTFRDYAKGRDNSFVMMPPVDFIKWQEKLGDDYLLLFRAHSAVTSVMSIENNSFVRDVSSYPNTNDLMLISDILISDYSSIYFDYSIMHKPMLCYAYDYDEYAQKRGMYFDIRDWLPSASSEEELLELIKNTDVTRTSEATVAFQKQYVTEYGSATKQALDIIYENIC
jgi:CDP-glycerol glycerophosphotransferase